MDNLIDAKPQLTKRASGFGCRIATTFSVLFIIVALQSCPVDAGFPFSAQILASEQIQDDEGATALTESQRLGADQRRLAEQYKLLEEKLFSLHEFEKGNDVVRSKLLERAFLQSQETMTADRMRLIVKLLSGPNLKAAESEQEQVLVQLKGLLQLLQSEDRGKRVRDEIQRHQEYLKEVERILRIQKGIRGQAEGGVDAKRLANSENKTADRTGKLAGEILENEEGGQGDRNSGGENDKSKRGDDENPNESDQESGEGKENNPKTEPDSKGQNDRGNNSEPGQPGKPGQPGDGDAQSSQSQQNENPARKRIQAAEKKMREAIQKLEQARRDESVEDMKQAEREMALAKRQLEEILRQLREEEVERTLAMLEGRFRQMLERQVRMNDSTVKLDQTASGQRGTDFEIRSGRLSVEQNSIATEAARALLLLREDGSSVAFPATVDEMHQDMLQVASRLSAAKVGRITIEIEEDILETLNYLVEALVKTQEDLERMKQKSQPAGQAGQPGDKPLVDQLAEIKMLRGLQERIFRRHSRYAKFLDDPSDPVGNTDDLELQAALLRLSRKQAQLTEIARDIVNEKNK